MLNGHQSQSDNRLALSLSSGSNEVNRSWRVFLAHKHPNSIGAGFVILADIFIDALTNELIVRDNGKGVSDAVIRGRQVQVGRCKGSANVVAVLDPVSATIPGQTVQIETLGSADAGLPSIPPTPMPRVNLDYLTGSPVFAVENETPLSVILHPVANRIERCGRN